ncbi:TPA: hypothetical protein HNC51_15640 [Escherichia coli]|nr:hypothetical protein DEP49_24765 [Escherichia coli]EDF6235574.1 hypothetical protein [Salmonella enterica subsp. enterica serovar Senftenberg]EDH0096520.1 hypothetical protein [Salmonella enterica subsp. enterica serovar Infantis]EDZ5954996.1 hypothetical protein [Salmonella enterica]OJR58588.1 hypothetical protein BK385_20145 [Escherichia coli]
MLTGGGVVWGEREIRNRRKPDLRGRKDANNMIIKNTHKIISDMIFIIDEKTIPDIIINQEHTNHA